MPYSSGTYSLPSGNPVVTGTTISSSTTNTTNSDIATALSTCVLKDGTQTITANLPMASHKLTGLSAGTTAGDSVEYGGSPEFAAVSVAGSTSGTCTLQAPAVAGSTVLTLPAVSGTVLVSNTSVITSATAQASTSGTSIDFTGIPSWAKRVTVMFNGVAISASGILIQIGSGSVTTSGYASSSVLANTGTTANTSSTAGFVSYAYTTTAASALYQLALVSANSWVCNGALSIGLGTVISTVGNSPALSGALDRVRITTISGAATFTAGAINIMYE